MTNLFSRVIDKRLFWFTVGAVVIMVGCFALVAWTLQYSHDSACTARDKSLDVTQAIVFFAQHEHGRDSHDPFFTRAYQLIEEARC